MAAVDSEDAVEGVDDVMSVQGTVMVNGVGGGRDGGGGGGERPGSVTSSGRKSVQSGL